MSSNKYQTKPQQPKPCKSCGKLIVFLETKSNKKIPINWDSLDAEEQRFLTEAGSVDYEHGRHISHFADCPEAKNFRRGR